MKEKRIIKNGKVENQKVVYYEDELKDEFSEAKIEPIIKQVNSSKHNLSINN